MSIRLPTVEALRAFGAISVLWMHCIWLGPWDFPRGLGAWFHHGWLGVDLFLIISGFATTRALFQGLNSPQTQPLCNYWRNRLARIYPLYLLTCVVFRFSVYNLSDQNRAVCLHWISQLPGLCEGFFLGVLIAKFAQYRDDAGFIATAADRRNTAIIFASGLVSSILLVILLEDVNQQYWDTWLFPTLFRSAVALAFALVVWAAVRFHAERPQCAANKHNPLQTIAERLGAWSYGIYLWHLPVLLMLKKSTHLEGQGALLFLLTLSIAVALAAASYRWLEQPCMQWARRRAR